jgi:hypothetical protein
MIRNTRFAYLIALIGFSGFVFACGSGGSGGGTGGAAGSTGNNGGSNSGNGGSSSNGGSNSSNGGNTSSNGGSTTGNAMCDAALASLGGDGCNAYNDCMAENCAAEYEGCMGANYQDGDFSGGACEGFLTCVVDDCECDEACTQGCELDSGCQNCFVGWAFSSCSGQSCGDELSACANSQGAGGSNGGGGSSNSGGGSGGTGGIPGLSDATCADLTACCAGLGADLQATCDAVVTAGNDLGCSAAFTGFGCE